MPKIDGLKIKWRGDSDSGGTAGTAADTKTRRTD
jgi:hypothetical protein